MQLLDRKQQHLELVLISVSYFVEVSSPCVSPAAYSPASPAGLGSPSSNHLNFIKNRPMVHTLCSQESDLWINVNNLLYFFPRSETNEVQFICVNEDTGFRHLYLYTVPLVGVSNGIEDAFDTTSGLSGGSNFLIFNFSCLVKHLTIFLFLVVCAGQPPSSSRHISLTSGPWEVLGQQLWVDPENNLVYFLGLRENPLEKHLYAVSLQRPGEIRLLTQPGFSYNVDFSQVFKCIFEKCF